MRWESHTRRVILGQAAVASSEYMRVEIASQYAPHKMQLQLHRGGKRYLVATAGVRGGKTKSCAYEFVHRIYLDLKAGKAYKVSGVGKRRRPALHYWLCAPTAALLREPLRYLFETIPQPLIERYYEAEKQLWLKGDILIELKSTENPMMLVSAGLNGLWIDEAARVKSDAWHGQLRSRLSDKSGWALFSTSPLGRSNWVYQELVSQAYDNDDIHAITWRTIDNPYIPKEEIEKAKRELPLAWYKRDYEASWDSFGGTVFDEFKDETHITTEPKLRIEYGLGDKPIRTLFRRVLAGVDFGWSEPGAIVVVADLGNHRYLVLDESYASNRIVHDVRLNSGTWVSEAKRLRDKWGISQFFCDTASPGSINDLQRAGLNVLSAEKDIYVGVRKLCELHHVIDGKPSLQVLSHCSNLIREMRNYQWQQDKHKTGHVDKPAENQSDHGIDALRYSFTELVKYADVQPVREHARVRPIG